jgi:hypothetical protein
VSRGLSFRTLRAQEKPIEVNASIARWLATAVPGVWLV